MNSLSNEILSLILTQVRSGGHNDILACLRVNRTWYQIGTPVFHRHIVLDNSRIIPFYRSFRLDCGPQVRTLTLLISSEGRHLVDGNSRPHPGLDAKLRRIISLLNRLDHLVSFSLSLEGQGETFLKQATIKDIIEALPETCVNLELDTQGQEQESEGSAHLCDSLRRMMPRMQHLRIRVASLCPALLGIGDLPRQGDSAAVFKPVGLPNIRSLVIYCALAFSRKTRLCSPGRQFHLETEYTGPSWIPITTAAEHLTVASKLPPAGARILVINATGPLCFADCIDRTKWQAVIVAEPTARRSRAVPHRLICGRTDSVFVRLPKADGHNDDLVTTLMNVVLLAEGETWCGTVGGARVPRAVLEGAGEDEGPRSVWFAEGLGVRASLVPLRTAAQWIEEKHPECIRHPFRDEDVVGNRLLEVETKEGKGRYLSVEPVEERIPEGYLKDIEGNLHKVPAI